MEQHDRAGDEQGHDRIDSNRFPEQRLFKDFDRRQHGSIAVAQVPRERQEHACGRQSGAEHYDEQCEKKELGPVEGTR
ncbi:MAG TPA: hypothetical protein DCS42_15365 [Nitrospiraceae bacterium]|nr:hypothetical protein [Nitrospiraceae bacterium]